MNFHSEHDVDHTDAPHQNYSGIPKVPPKLQDISRAGGAHESYSSDRSVVHDTNVTDGEVLNCLFRGPVENSCLSAKATRDPHTQMIHLVEDTTSSYSSCEREENEPHSTDEDCLPHTRTNYSEPSGDVRVQCSLLYSSCGHKASSSGGSYQHKSVKSERQSTTSLSSWRGEDRDRPGTYKCDDYIENVPDKEQEDDDVSNASDADFDIAFIKKPRGKCSSQGIPLLFKKLDDSPPALSEVCLGCAEQHIAATAQERPLTIGLTRKGHLRVTVGTTTAASLLQDMDNLGDLPVQVVLPRAYSDNVAKISKVPLVYTDAQIRGFFAASGVVSAKRQVHYRLREEDGALEAVPRDTVVLTFCPERTIPERIRPSQEHAEALDYRFFPVREHVSVPTQCYNCFRFGHMAKHCRRRTRCKVCARYHSYRQCTAIREQLRCCNCKGRHAATYCGCPVRLAAVRDKREALKYDPRPRDGDCY